MLVSYAETDIQKTGKILLRSFFFVRPTPVSSLFISLRFTSSTRLASRFPR